MKDKKTKRFKLAEAYDYAFDRTVADIIIEVNESMCYFIVERYFDAEENAVVDPEYYNPFATYAFTDYKSAFDKLGELAKTFRVLWNDEEVEIR